MAFKLYANVQIPTTERYYRSGRVRHNERINYRILVGTFSSKAKAQKQAQETTRVYIDLAQTILVPEHRIGSFEIEEE